MKVKQAKKMKAKTYAPFESLVGNNPQNYVVHRGIGFPDALQTNLVYTDSILLDPSSGNPTPVFSVGMNNAFDPQAALGGGQPTYFDQLAQIYGRYRVEGAKLTAVFSRSSGTTAGAGPYICGINCSDVAGVPTVDAGALISAPNTSWKVVSDQDGSIAVAATYSRKKIYPNVTDGCQARTNASPNVLWYGTIFASPQNVDVETAINCVFVIEYNIVFDDLKYVVDT